MTFRYYWILEKRAPAHIFTTYPYTRSYTLSNARNNHHLREASRYISSECPISLYLHVAFGIAIFPRLGKIKASLARKEGGGDWLGGPALKAPRQYRSCSSILCSVHLCFALSFDLVSARLWRLQRLKAELAAAQFSCRKVAGWLESHSSERKCQRPFATRDAAWTFASIFALFSNVWFLLF